MRGPLIKKPERDGGMLKHGRRTHLLSLPSHLANTTFHPFTLPHTSTTSFTTWWRYPHSLPLYRKSYYCNNRCAGAQSALQQSPSIFFIFHYLRPRAPKSDRTRRVRAISLPMQSRYLTARSRDTDEKGTHHAHKLPRWLTCFPFGRSILLYNKHTSCASPIFRIKDNRA